VSERVARGANRRLEETEKNHDAQFKIPFDAIRELT
jgi:hypothetical protein